MRLIEGTFPPIDPAIAKLSVRTAQLIVASCRQLGMPLTTSHYALWVFHANSVTVGFKKMDRFVYGCAAILLGAKLSDNLRRLDDIISVWRKLVKKTSGKQSIEDDEQMLKRYKKKVLEAEVSLMSNIAFDLDIQLAISYLYALEQSIESEVYTAVERYVKEVYRTQLVVYYQPHVIVLAGLATAYESMSINTKKISGRDWFRFFNGQTSQEYVNQMKNHYEQLMATIKQ